MSANDRQVGGDHYQSSVQCWDYIIANQIPYLEGQIIRYLTRWRKKNGIEDVYKAKHYLDKLIEVEEKNVQKSFSEEKVERLVHQPNHNSHTFVPKLKVTVDYPLTTETYNECYFCGALSGSMLAKQPCTKRPSNEIKDLSEPPLSILRVLATYQIDTMNDSYFEDLLSQRYYQRMPQISETTFVQNESEPIVINMRGYCMCDYETVCLLGKTGSKMRCTNTELEAAGYKTIIHNSSSQRNERVFDNHGFAYYQGDGCEFGHHVWEPLPDYEAGNVCIHCGIRETK